jgi:DnaJ-class molecular chaperone
MRNVNTEPTTDGKVTLPCERCHGRGWRMSRWKVRSAWGTEEEIRRVCPVCNGLKFVRVEDEPVGETRTST